MIWGLLYFIWLCIATVIIIVCYTVWAVFDFFWILIKWIHGMFYKKRHGYKPYRKIKDGVPRFPKFEKLWLFDAGLQLPQKGGDKPDGLTDEEWEAIKEYRKKHELDWIDEFEYFDAIFDDDD